VDVLGHDRKAIDEQFILLAHGLQSADEEIPWRGCAKFWLAAITAERKVVVLTRLLEMLQPYSMSLLPELWVVCDRGTPPPKRSLDGAPSRFVGDA
jgi:hypothetical protein